MKHLIITASDFLLNGPFVSVVCKAKYLRSKHLGWRSARNEMRSEEGMKC